jgi:hypothetical protein
MSQAEEVILSDKFSGVDDAPAGFELPSTLRGLAAGLCPGVPAGIPGLMDRVGRTTGSATPCFKS